MKRKVINSIYGVAVAGIVALIGMVIFGQEAFRDYSTMLNVSLGDRAYFALMIASIPMICLGIAVCNYNDIKNSKHPKLYKFLIYIPAIICVGCILFTIGIVVFSMIRFLISDFKEFQEIDATININDLTK